MQEQAYIRTSDGTELIEDLPQLGGACLADTPSAHCYGSRRIIKYVHSSCPEFEALAQAVRSQA